MAGDLDVAVQTNVQLNVTRIAERVVKHFDHEPELKARIAQALSGVADEQSAAVTHEQFAAVAHGQTAAVAHEQSAAVALAGRSYSLSSMNLTRRGVLRWFHRNLDSEEPRIECEGRDRCNRDPATVRVAVINQDIAIGRASSAHQPNKRIIDRRRISPNGLEGLE